jgi:hypothetical protein
MQFRGIFFLGDHGEQLLPDLVFEQHLRALHLEASVKNLQINLLVGGEFLKTADCQLVFD